MFTIGNQLTIIKYPYAFDNQTGDIYNLKTKKRLKPFFKDSRRKYFHVSIFGKNEKKNR